MISFDNSPLTRAAKGAFRLAINKAGSSTERRKLQRLRHRIASGTLDKGDAFVAWLDLRLTVDPTRIPKPRADAPRGTHRKANS